MIIEVRGVNTVNKGAELMLRAIIAELGQDHRIVLGPRSADYASRARLGLEQRLEASRGDRLADVFGGFLPQRIRASYGLVLPREVDVVLDASGFSYSDQFGPHRSLAAARRAEQDARASRSWICMPQAFGPFMDPETRDAFRRLAAQCEAVYARDRVSMRHAREALPATAALRNAPDFTSTLPAAAVPQPDAPFLAVVPNQKVVDKGSAADAAGYVDFLSSTAAAVHDATGLRAKVIVHESRDARLAEALTRAMPFALDAVREKDPQVLKGVIGTAHLVLGSRFHALVSALSQAVPTVAVGWTHKYTELFAGYGQAEAVVGMDCPGDAVRLLTQWASGDPRTDAVTRLRTAAHLQADRERAFWADLRHVLASVPRAV